MTLSSANNLITNASITQKWNGSKNNYEAKTENKIFTISVETFLIEKKIYA